MARLREIKKWGGSLIVVFTAPDLLDLGISEGDMINLEDVVIIKKGKKKFIRLLEERQKV